jgi:hypothetical protein
LDEKRSNEEKKTSTDEIHKRGKRLGDDWFYSWALIIKLLRDVTLCALFKELASVVVRRLVQHGHVLCRAGVFLFFSSSYFIFLNKCKKKKIPMLPSESVRW